MHQSLGCGILRGDEIVTAGERAMTNHAQLVFGGWSAT